jgi:hypothetical protein
MARGVQWIVGRWLTFPATALFSVSSFGALMPRDLTQFRWLWAILRTSGRTTGNGAAQLAMVSLFQRRSGCLR